MPAATLPARILGPPHGFRGNPGWPKFNRVRGLVSRQLDPRRKPIALLIKYRLLVLALAVGRPQYDSSGFFAATTPDTPRGSYSSSRR